MWYASDTPPLRCVVKPTSIPISRADGLARAFVYLLARVRLVASVGSTRDDSPVRHGAPTVWGTPPALGAASPRPALGLPPPPRAMSHSNLRRHVRAARAVPTAERIDR